MQSLQIDDQEQALSTGAKKRQTLELANERLEKAIEQLRLANEALRESNQELGSLSNQLEMMNEEMESLSQEVIRLRAERQLSGGYVDPTAGKDAKGGEPRTVVHASRPPVITRTRQSQVQAPVGG